MSTIEKLQRTHSFPTIRVQTPPDGSAHWLYMHADAGPGVRPCCRFEMLEDMWSYMSSITLREPQRQQGRLRHFVLASAASAYNLGGDLDLFTHLIREGNRDRLLAYAQRCVEGVHHLHTATRMAARCSRWPSTWTSPARRRRPRRAARWCCCTAG